MAEPRSAWSEARTGHGDDEDGPQQHHPEPEHHRRKQETTQRARPSGTGQNEEEPVHLPAPTAGEDLLSDYAALGLTLGPHPMALLRDEPAFRHCRRASDLERMNHGRFVRLAGLVTGRQRPSSASGVLFMTLEDETGNANVVIWTSILTRFRAAILGSQLVLVKGVVEREGSVIHVVAGQVADFSHYLGKLRAPSRDFR
ncbi:MAG: OB-fold nucleic acid binding domain-containing protein [Pseudomonadales bacterium]|nr:OB-fold nucleic acid binding domain-containing protein [Pseudomonadales bacterium]